MLDFFTISTRSPKKGIVEVYPEFIVGARKDLMTRGGDFYAVWNEETSLWSTDEDDVIRVIDDEIAKVVEQVKKTTTDQVKGMYMHKSSTGTIDVWHRYVQKQLRKNYHPLDDNITFANVETSRETYATRKLLYSIEDIPTPAYDEMMDKLYSPEERHKIEWAIGAIITGESKYIQKFLVLYGSGGTGKSTVLHIIEDLFKGYYTTFDAKALGSANSAFALEPFAANPLVAIQHDGDLSHIEDNTRLNSLVSHEDMIMNEKYKQSYSMHFNSFLFMGTNKPVKITDAKSGIIRRLIDVSPTGETFKKSKYDDLNSKIKFELGGIAYHCKTVYENDPGAYDNYIPLSMMGATNDFYNYVLEYYDIFKRDDSTTLKQAYEMYLTYCEAAKVPYPMSKMKFKEEFKNYWYTFVESTTREGEHMKNMYEGFMTSKFETEHISKLEKLTESMEFNSNVSKLDYILADCPAQYANDKEAPRYKWSDVTTTLQNLDTTKLHYVKVPDNLIVIDFDLKDKYGNKSFKLNAEAANKFPPTYAELSKGGQGIHLHYWYNGDVDQLSCIYADDIEVKVFKGNSSLRRRLSKCNDLDISTISSGLPLKEAKKTVNFTNIANEKSLRTLIKKNLNKEYQPATKPSVDFIFKILNDAYNSGVHYDVTDMRPAVLAFAANSTHNADYCIKLVNKMPFHSEEASEAGTDDEAKPLIFYDVEVFSNLFVVVYKMIGSECVKMINPTSNDIERLLGMGRLVGFNNRRYDNHILYARLIGYDNFQLYGLSQRIINGSPNAMFREAYNLSYTDIYDYASTKQSLKKWEIELDIHHQECPLRWDEPVEEKDYDMVADYCCNDVEATEAVWNATQGDFTARKILAAIAGGSVNDTTNTLTTKFIFGNNKNPELVYTELGKPQDTMDPAIYNYLLHNPETEAMVTHNWSKELPEPTAVPYFPGYEFDNGHNTYRGEDVGKGGYVYAEPGTYYNVGLLDVKSMHPHSLTAMCLFGPEYTQRFKDIVDARILIKEKKFDEARRILNGALAPFLDDETVAKQLAQALKIAINSVYGLTSATFDNPFRDSRNINNIVALRGALFMVNLKHEVQKRGYTVVHIKTDSIKIAGVTPEIIKFCMDYAKLYGYEFDHEATYDRICLVNDAVYIARHGNDGEKGQWTATGKQFQVPYIFKKLFTQEPIEFKDICEAREVKSALYMDCNEGLPEGEHNYVFVGRVGEFVPVKDGYGGAELLRESGEGKYASVTGCKGYRWLESETVRKMENWRDIIDYSYFDNLLNDAVDNMKKNGCDVERFRFDPIDEPPWD